MNTQDRISRATLALFNARGIRQQKDMAEALGWDPTRLSRLVNRKAQWSVEDIEQLAAYFEVGPGVFFSDDVTAMDSRWELDGPGHAFVPAA